MNGEIQYIADSFLLERVFKILNNSGEEGLQKHAFDLGSVLSGIGSSIKSYVGGQVAGKDEGGVARTVTNLLAPAMFFRLHPILGMAATAAQLFGIDLYSIFQKIAGAIMPSVEKGEPVSSDVVNQAAMGAAGNTAMASDDFLAPLRAMEESGELKKIAVSWGRPRGNAWSRQEFIPKDKSPFVRMFSFMRPRQRGSILVGIVVWFVKTILMSAGLLAGVGAASSMLGKKPTGVSSSPQQSQQQPTTPQGGGGGAARTSPGVDQRNTGAGATNYKPNPNDMWIENLGGQQPHERLLQWTEESYPGLYQYQDIILRTPAFWNAVSAMTKGWPTGQQQLIIENPNFKSRDDILKLFVPQVFDQINRGNVA